MVIPPRALLVLTGPLRTEISDAKAMNRPQKIRKVYEELRRSFGPAVAASELLECAAVLVSISENKLGLPMCGTSRDSIPFEELPLDELYSKWPWKLVCQELQVEDSFEIKEDPKAIIDRLCAQSA